MLIEQENIKSELMALSDRNLPVDPRIKARACVHAMRYLLAAGLLIGQIYGWVTYMFKCIKSLNLRLKFIGTFFL